jgi:hypothetical protein
MKTKTKKLALNKSTVRNLSGAALSAAVGGDLGGGVVPPQQGTGSGYNVTAPPCINDTAVSCLSKCNCYVPMMVRYFG